MDASLCDLLLRRPDLFGGQLQSGLDAVDDASRGRRDPARAFENAVASVRLWGGTGDVDAGPRATGRIECGTAELQLWSIAGRVDRMAIRARDETANGDGAGMIELTAPKNVILAENRIPLRCATCGLPFGYLIIQNGVILIESRHHGEIHTNVIPLVAPLKGDAPDDSEHNRTNRTAI